MASRAGRQLYGHKACMQRVVGGTREQHMSEKSPRACEGGWLRTSRLLWLSLIWLGTPCPVPQIPPVEDGEHHAKSHHLILIDVHETQ